MNSSCAQTSPPWDRIRPKAFWAFSLAPCLPALERERRLLPLVTSMPERKEATLKLWLVRSPFVPVAPRTTNTPNAVACAETDALRGAADALRVSHALPSTPLPQEIAAERPTSVCATINQMIAASRFSSSKKLAAAHPSLLVLAGRGDRLANPFCSERLAKKFGGRWARRALLSLLSCSERSAFSVLMMPPRGSFRLRSSLDSVWPPFLPLIGQAGDARFCGARHCRR